MAEGLKSAPRESRLGAPLTAGLLAGLVLTAACGPAGPTFDPAGPLFEGWEVKLDPEALVPFGSVSESIAPTVTRAGDRLDFTLPPESLAASWEVVVVEGGEALVAALEPGAVTFDLPAGTERAGLRAVQGELRGSVSWSAAADAGLGSGQARGGGLFFRSGIRDLDRL